MVFLQAIISLIQSLSREKAFSRSARMSMSTITTTPNEAQPANWTAPAGDDALRDTPLKDLLSDITDRVKLLARKEAELAKAELQSNLQSSVAMAKNLGIAALCGLLGLNMLLVAAVLALATMTQPWVAALIVAAPLLAVGVVMGGIGWSKRVKNPLEATRASLKEDFQWMKNRLA